MRVHDTRTGQFRDHNANDPPYAILSHTWDASEQSFQDVRQIQDSTHIRTLLRMVYPAVPWLLVVSLSYLLRVLADVAGWHYPFLHTRESNLRPCFQLQSKFSTTNEAQHGCIFRQLIRITSALRLLSQSLNDIADQIFPQLSILNDLRLSKKVRQACAVARLDGWSQLWVDTSCIDKTSSSELSEAINSMFAWYRDAAVCYVYLADVPQSGDPRRRGSAFRHSRWFTRGWTLQELIAPQVVIFLAREWEIIGTKESLADLIEDITGIHRDVLMHRTSHNDVSVAARMSWAAERTTTRIEDQAYCLLGLFGIVMTPIYGEGEHAFTRLQEEILRRIPDDSIFAWEMPLVDPLAESRPPSQDAAVSRNIIC